MRRSLFVVGVAAAVLLVAAAVTCSLASARGKPVMAGVVVGKGVAIVEASDQMGAQGFLKVARVRAPGDSWVVVYNEAEEGMPGALVGLVHVPPGESRDVRVPLDPDIRMTEHVDVVLQADRGTPSVFEFDETRFATSPDKPYSVGLKKVQARVWVRFSEMSNSFQTQ